LPSLLHDRQYDAIILDLVEERYKLIKCNGAYATLSSEFVMTGIQKTHGIKKISPFNQNRRQLWKDGLNSLLLIAKEKNVPIFLNQVYAAKRYNTKISFDFYRSSRFNLNLQWLYKQVPSHVTRFRVPRDVLIADYQHKWGKSLFHYTVPVYKCLLSQFDNALGETHLEKAA